MKQVACFAVDFSKCHFVGFMRNRRPPNLGQNGTTLAHDTLSVSYWNVKLCKSRKSEKRYTKETQNSAISLPLVLIDFVFAFCFAFVLCCWIRFGLAQIILLTLKKGQLPKYHTPTRTEWWTTVFSLRFSSVLLVASTTTTPPPPSHSCSSTISLWVADAKGDKNLHALICQGRIGFLPAEVSRLAEEVGIRRICCERFPSSRSLQNPPRILTILGRK